MKPKPSQNGHVCPNCVKLEKQVAHERARVDKYADLFFRMQAQKTGVSIDPPVWEPQAPLEPLPEQVQQAIKMRSQPNEPLRGELNTRARDMLAAGVSEGDVIEQIMKGEQVPEL